MHGSIWRKRPGVKSGQSWHEIVLALAECRQRGGGIVLTRYTTGAQNDQAYLFPSHREVRSSYRRANEYIQAEQRFARQ
jgi:hypothetical protein